MKASVGALVAVALLLGTTGWAGDIGSPVGAHRSTGVVVAIAPGEITLREGGRLHPMATDRRTRIVLSPEDRVLRIGVGDYVAEECVPDGKGGATAVKLTLYRPAWMENASPEN